MQSRRMALGAALALAASTSLVAQSAHDTARVAGRSVTVSGCVERAGDVLGDAGGSGYVLVAANGGGHAASTAMPHVYRLTGGERMLSGELGNRVVVTGSIPDPTSNEARDDRRADTSGRRATSPADGDERQSRSSATAPELLVESAHATTGPCPAGWW